mgnify:CR=1 FL=1
MLNRLGLVLHWFVSIISALLIIFGIYTHTKGSVKVNPRYSESACNVEKRHGRGSYFGLRMYCQKTHRVGYPSRSEKEAANVVIVLGLVLLPIFVVILFVITGRWIWLPWKYLDE